MQKDMPEIPEAEAEQYSRQPARLANASKRLLVADDEAVIRELLRRYLEQFGYTVDLAQDGDEVWRKVQSLSYDCIVLDMNMPGMNGVQLYKLINASHKRLAQKVIFITGGGVTPEPQDLSSAVTNPILLKPFDMDELHRQILNIVDGADQLSKCQLSWLLKGNPMSRLMSTSE